MTIFIIGNPLVPNDNLPIKWKARLEKIFPEIKFEMADVNENFPRMGERNIVVLDTVINIKEPMIFNLDDFKKTKKSPASLHDYDLLLHLLLLKKLKKIETVKIIGIPNISSKKNFDNLVKIISKNQFSISGNP